MQAVVYRGEAGLRLEDRPKPQIAAPSDAIVRLARTTICGTDLHILKVARE
jgi:alcohol dehydrogenase